MVHDPEGRGALVPGTPLPLMLTALRCNRPAAAVSSKSSQYYYARAYFTSSRSSRKPLLLISSSSSSSSIYQIPNTEHMAYRLLRTLVYKRGVGIRETVLTHLPTY